jgi:hypothetical protein
VGAEIRRPASARKSQLSVSKGSHARVLQPGSKVERGFQVFDSLRVFDGIAGHNPEPAHQIRPPCAIEIVRVHQRKRRAPVGRHLFVGKYRKCLFASLDRIVNCFSWVADSY